MFLLSRALNIIYLQPYLCRKLLPFSKQKTLTPVSYNWAMALKNNNQQTRCKAYYIVHEPTLKTFTLDVRDLQAKLVYEKSRGVMTILHTDVPEELEGLGIGTKLAQTALDFARDHDMMVAIECAFVKRFVERHSKIYGDLIAQ